MKLLLIGGPKFLGHALIEAALARGHEVTTFNRGQTNPDAFPEIEKLHGDRDGDLSALEGRTWDAVVDTSGYVPRIVRGPPSSLAGSAGRYAFVSSISYYADYREPRVETDPAEQLGDHPADRLLEDYSNYGALKALCEQEIVRELRRPRDPRPPRPDRRPERPDRPLHILAAPRQRGGPMLAPPDQPVQMIDVRDLAGWMITLRRERAQRPVQRDLAAGHASRSTRCFAACGAEDVVWVTQAFMTAQGVEGWSDLPCWIPFDRHRPRRLPARPGRPRGRRRARPSGRSPRRPATSPSGRARQA